MMNLFVQALAEFFQNYADLWKLAIIPLSAAVIGWGTNVLAIQMTFYPIEFTGIGRLGWQGIIPSRAAKMAAISVDLMVGKLIDVKEQFRRIRAEGILATTLPLLETITVETLDEALHRHLPVPWRFLPDRYKTIFFQQVKRQIPDSVRTVLADVQDNIEDLLDIKEMVVAQLTANKALLNKVFLECGKQEFRFIERSGIYFGFAFGVLQMLLWYHIQHWEWAWITLPLGGLVVGYLTNWLALEMIFKPKKPVKIGYWTLHGLFLKRQKDVAEVYAKVVADEILTTQNIFQAILKGKNQDKLRALVRRNVRQSVRRMAGLLRTAIQLLGGVRAYNALENAAERRFEAAIPQVVARSINYADHALDMENTLKDKMTNLSSAEFEGFLHPVFKEDELKLILVGAFLGMVAGCIQVLTLI